jgi:hypothetical protein
VRVLFDQGVPAPLRHHLTDHLVETAHERGWSKLQNGELLRAAEAAGFELLLTTDRHLKHQQNLAGRRLVVVVLLSTSWPRIAHSVETIREALSRAQPGSYEEVPIEPPDTTTR